MTDLLETLESKLNDDPADVVRQVREFLAQKPFSVPAYRLLAAALDEIERRSPIRGEVRTSLEARGADLERAMAAMTADDFRTAGETLLKRLSKRPTDVDALSLMAELASVLKYFTEAEDLLRYVVEISPECSGARIELARLLEKQDRPSESRELLEFVLAREPANLFAKAVYASSLGRTGRYDESVREYEQLLRALPEQSDLWSTYGHTLTTVGRAEDGLRAMRRAIAIDPENGEAWWHIANTKSGRFDAQEIATMRSLLDRGVLTSSSRAHINFALGKAYEDSGDAAEAFAYYDRANAIRRQSDPYDVSLTVANNNASIELFSREFFEEHRGFGASARDPIFIVGMPRAGSTLIEQILASHSSIEGTRELLDISNIARELSYPREEYFRNVAALRPKQAQLLGETYIERTRMHRVTDRPLFIDKAPTNWTHIGLIQLILPNAKIIDARRHPLACGFSNFKQSYDRGHAYSYGLATIGQFYSEYVRLMAHWDAALPGRVHRVIHERLVDDTEGEIRRMLDYLELPFEAACLRFFETDRAVRTPSAEQVRRPISRDHMDQWRKFEPWLGPLKEALGPALEAYPEAPRQNSPQAEKLG